MPRIAITTDDYGREARDFYTSYPALGAAAGALVEAVYSPANPLSIRVREAVRIRIALINQCMVCWNARLADLPPEFHAHIADWREHPETYSPAEQAAIEYAELFGTDHLAIDDAVFERLRAHFSEEEIAAIAISAAYFSAFGRLTRVLLLDHACPVEFGPRMAAE